MQEEKQPAKRPASPVADHSKRSNVLTAMQRAKQCAMVQEQMTEPIKLVKQ